MWASKPGEGEKSWRRALGAARSSSPSGGNESDEHDPLAKPSLEPHARHRCRPSRGRLSGSRCWASASAARRPRLDGHCPPLAGPAPPRPTRRFNFAHPLVSLAELGGLADSRSGPSGTSASDQHSPQAQRTGSPASADAPLAAALRAHAPIRRPDANPGDAGVRRLRGRH